MHLSYFGSRIFKVQIRLDGQLINSLNELKKLKNSFYLGLDPCY